MMFSRSVIIALLLCFVLLAEAKKEFEVTFNDQGNYAGFTVKKKDNLGDVAERYCLSVRNKCSRKTLKVTHGWLGLIPYDLDKTIKENGIKKGDMLYIKYA